ncbi:hypothetical protein [uncultured Flavonifractor sp.]|uniref:hypothetical protein n=1 Tax=uncultured Flavonifractor sp. TaxID=1193534 RepID=UPI002606012F|nr:hypothetical protein [uncultured Flavonifractor sp.]
MEITVEQYKIAVNNATEISQMILDMEGGKFILAMFVEMLQDLLAEGNVSGAASVMRKLHDVAEVSFKQDLSDVESLATWLLLFSEVLDDILDGEPF